MKKTIFKVLAAYILCCFVAILVAGDSTYESPFVILEDFDTYFTAYNEDTGAIYYVFKSEGVCRELKIED